MIVAGLVAPSAGTVEVNGSVVASPITDVGIAFQDSVLLEWRTALGNVMLQAEAKKLDRQSAMQDARDLMGSVGLGGFESLYPHELSGGMRQRVAICRALLHNPALLLMDEPFGSLDALTRDQLSVDLQHLWMTRRSTVIFVTHSIDEAVFLSDRVVVMTPRPGHVDKAFQITIPRPRSLRVRESSEFNDFSRQIKDLFLASGVLKDE
jgi:NitT/TauT family transport system ATP-binding protein